MAEYKEPFDYDVGYKKPPVHTRFQTGRSGNPRGRPKGSNHFAALRRVLDQTVPVTENGRRKKVTKIEAAMTQLLNNAARGDAKAFQAIMKLMMLLGLKPEEEKKGNVTFIIEE